MDEFEQDENQILCLYILEKKLSYFKVQQRKICEEYNYLNQIGMEYITQKEKNIIKKQLDNKFLETCYIINQIEENINKFY